MSTQAPIAWPPQEDARGPVATFGGVPLADWGARFAAFGIDAGIALGAGIAVAATIGAGLIPVLAVSAVVWLVECVALVGRLDGATPGKSLCGMTVVDDEGEPIGFGTAFARYLFSSIGGTYGIVDAMMTAGHRRRSLTDRVVGTRVLQTPAYPRRWPWRGLGWLLGIALVLTVVVGAIALRSA